MWINGAFLIILLLQVTFLSCLTSASEVISDWPYTKISRFPSHYPCFCSFTDAVFKWEDPQFHIRHGGEDTERLISDCHGLSSIWDVNNEPGMSKVTCDVTYDVGYVFTIYYWAKGSNYYHLFYDLVIPLFKDVYYQKSGRSSEDRKILFMPTVESSRMNKLNWDTDAFVPPQDKKYWNEIARQVAGEFEYAPLDREFINRKKNVCFRELKFGAPSVDFGDSGLLKGVANHFMERLGVVGRVPFVKHRVGIITRSNRRRIVNEKDLIEAVKGTHDIELVEFTKKTLEQQVEMMQRYSVLVGMNGAGLMNSLFLPRYSVCIQLVPYKAKLNFVQYGKLLKARGPYMEWHNKHENLTIEMEHDDFRHRSDTIVHVEEFKSLIDEAVQMADRAREKLTTKDEL